MPTVEQEKKIDQPRMSIDLEVGVNIGLEIAIDSNKGNFDSRCLLIGLLAAKLQVRGLNPEVISGTLLLFGIKPMKLFEKLASPLALTDQRSQKSSLNEDVKNIFKLAIENAQRAETQTVTPHHILTAIVEYGNGEAAETLDTYGLGKDKLLQLRAISAHPAFFSGFTPPKILTEILKDQTTNPVEKSFLVTKAFINFRK